MHPFLHIFGLTIKSYTLFLFLGEVLIVVGGTWLAERRNLPRNKVLFILIVMALSTLIGTRLFHALINFPTYRNDPSLLFNLSFAGQAIYGGLILAMIVGMFLSKKLNINYWRLGDSIAVPLGIGLVLIRIGCFLNGCCFGRETGLPWGVSFPLFSPAHNYQLSHNLSGLFNSHPVHPTQIYEMIIGLIVAAVAYLIIKKKMTDGVAILASGIIYTVFRFFNNFLRVPAPTFSAPIYFYPILYIIFAMFLCILLIARLRSEKSS